MPTELLLQLCQKIEIEANNLKNAEAPQNLHFLKPVPAGRLERISTADLSGLIETFQEGLTLTIGVPNASPLLEIRRGQVYTPLADALASITDLDNTFELQFDLVLNKEELLKQQLGTDRPYHSLLYFFKENLIKFLQSPLIRLDQTLFVDSYQPTLVVSLDAPIYYVSPLLIIAGQSYLHNARILLSPIKKNVRDRISKYHTTAFDNLNWAGFRLERLTPLHLLCRRADGEANPLDTVLADQLLHLCLLYTANRSSFDNNRFQVSFANSERTATLALEMGQLSAEGQDLLSRLALWPYGGEETDRLVTFQNVVARELESDNPQENYRIFIQQLRHLFDEARWHHRVFLDGQIDKHFEQIEKVNTYITGITKEVSQTLDSVTKGFTDALLATVGVIVLTLLASLIENKTQGVIFKIGMQAYAIYLFFFQVCYRMGSIGHSYILLKQETDTQLAIYAKKLDQSKVNQLKTPLASRQQQFLIWFWVTVGIYVAVIFLIWILGNSLPQYLVQQGIISPVPTPTATPPP